MSKSLYLFIAFSVFLLSGLVIAYISVKPSSPQKIASKISQNLKASLRELDVEAQVILKEIESENKITVSDDNQYAFLLYAGQNLIYWTSNDFIPPLQAFSDTVQTKVLKTSGGNYLLKKWNIKGDRFLVAVVPLHRKYKIRNDYLKAQWNTDVFPNTNILIEEPNALQGEAVIVNGQTLFKIYTAGNTLSYNICTQRTAVVLLATAIVMLVLLLYQGARYVKRYGKEWGLVLLVLCLVPLRIIMVQLNFPNILIKSDLFNPLNFASSTYNGSLGDMILNEIVVLSLCYYIFRNYYHFTFVKALYKRKYLSVASSVFFSLCILFAGLYPFVVVQTLYNNSSIALDISQSLQFNVLRIAALLAIVLSWGCSFLFAHVFIRLLLRQRNGFIAATFFVGVGIFILINEYTGQQYISSLIVTSVYLAVVFLLKLYASLKKLSYAMFAYLFVAVFCYAANGAYGIQYFNRREKIENQFRFANNFLIDRDNFGEYLLHDVSDKISGDAFIRIRVSSSFFNKEAVRQKVRQVFLPGYFNKYDVEVLLFNSTGAPYDNRTRGTFSELINQYNQEAFRTDYKDVYFINSPSTDVTQKYLVIVPIVRFTSTTGYVVVELSLKKIIPENVYPELLVDTKFQQFYKTQDLSYAVFSNKDIVFSSGDFNYGGLFHHDWLGNPDLYNKGIEKSGYIHIAQEDEIGRAAVVSSKTPTIMASISNFSFLLVLGFSVILLFILSKGLLSYIQGNKLFFSTRIQLFLNLAFFLPLIVVSIVTLTLSSQTSKDELDAEFLSKSKLFAEQIAAYLDDYIKGTNEEHINFENQLTDLSKYTNLDANVYNPQGTLLATSQPLIFENNLLTAYINPSAFNRIITGENLLVETEKVGSLTYFVSYAAIKSPQSGKLIGILGIPFFQSIHSLEKIHITIFTNILNIFAVIFIILLILSYFISEWLTFPLKFITQSLSKTTLTKVNQPLTWQTDDEIGLMVKEYNQMLFKLGESKAELEQTQRESAWREMAQQVAHEIKNPLTPMKLILQQLERAIKTDSGSKDKTEKALASLLTQVDTLSEIASSFSSFAKLPESIMHRVELVGLVKRIIILHNQTNDIEFKTSCKEIFVQGDEQLLGRTFSNLILNALQSGNAGSAITVTINLSIENNIAVLAFNDNGKGISDENIERVFVPHFSTKKSGSGLGLAIAKQGIELMGGKITFTTALNAGTTFYIELPASL